MTSHPELTETLVQTKWRVPQAHPRPQGHFLKRLLNVPHLFFWNCGTGLMHADTNAQARSSNFHKAPVAEVQVVDPALRNQYALTGWAIASFPSSYNRAELFLASAVVAVPIGNINLFRHSLNTRDPAPSGNWGSRSVVRRPNEHKWVYDVPCG